MTMDDIASQLSISKKTIYLYFADKDALVDAIMDIEINKSKSDCIECSNRSENAIHEIILSLESMSKDMSDTNPIVLHDLQKFYYPTFLKLVNLKNQFFAKIISDNLYRGIKEGYYEEDINVDVLTKMRIETIMLPLQQDIFPTDKFDFIKVNEIIIMHFIKGIVTERGRKLLAKYKSKS
jgi:AcrR family transcriptional regulator